MSFKFNRLVPILAVTLGAASVANAAQQCFTYAAGAPTVYGAVTTTVSGNCSDTSVQSGPFAPGTSQPMGGPLNCVFTFSKPLLTNSVTIQANNIGTTGNSLRVRLNGNVYQSAAADIGAPLAGTTSTNPLTIKDTGYTGTAAPGASGTLTLTNNPPETVTSIGISMANSTVGTIKVCADDAGIPAPTTSADSYSIAANNTLTVAAPGVLGNDSAWNDAPMNAALVTAPVNGSIVFNQDGSFAYTPNNGYIGADAFTYSVTANGVTSEPATVTLAVTGAAPAPTTATPVPAMGAWGLLALSPILGLAGFFGFSRRRKA